MFHNSSAVERRFADGDNQGLRLRYAVAVLLERRTFSLEIASNSPFRTFYTVFKRDLPFTIKH